MNTGGSESAAGGAAAPSSMKKGKIYQVRFLAGKGLASVWLPGGVQIGWEGRRMKYLGDAPSNDSRRRFKDMLLDAYITVPKIFTPEFVEDGKSFPPVEKEGLNYIGLLFNAENVGSYPVPRNTRDPHTQGIIHNRDPIYIVNGKPPILFKRNSLVSLAGQLQKNGAKLKHPVTGANITKVQKGTAQVAAAGGSRKRKTRRRR